MDIEIQQKTNWVRESNKGKSYLIAGPCSAETPDQIDETFSGLAALGVNAFRVGIWKPRTRPNTFEGLGFDALGWIKEAALEYKTPLMVEVAHPKHVEACLKSGIDMLWIGARTTVNPFMVQEIADALKNCSVPVFIKNPINPDLELWIGGIERIMQAGIPHVAAIHRGFSTYEKTAYRNNPHWEIPIELRRRMPNLPIICDPSHIAGISKMVPNVAQQALDLGFDGLMIEAHRNPMSAWSDAQQQLKPIELINLVADLIIRKPDISAISDSNKLDHIRKIVDEVDDKILHLLATRMELISELGDIKFRNNITILQPSRWDEIVSKRFRLANEIGVDKAFALKIWQLIHQHSINLQAKVYHKHEIDEPKID